jgi:hypothetical protein
MLTTKRLTSHTGVLPNAPSITVGCAKDDDCPSYNACFQRKCIDPCIEHNPCAPVATCQVISHKPVCACPDGYIGSPEISCRLRKYLVNSWLIYKCQVLTCF